MSLPGGVFAEGKAESQGGTSLDTIARRWRQRLERVRPETKLVVSFADGEQVEGALAEIGAETFGLWQKPSEEIALPSKRGDMRVKRHLRLEDVVRVTYGNGKPVTLPTEPPDAPARSFVELRFSVTPGDTVHVQDATGRKHRGRMTEMTSSQLTIHGWDGEAEPLTFRVSDVQRMELETTRAKSRAARGTLIGAGVGLGWGALALAGCNDPGCGEVAPAAIGVAALLGAGIGFAIGLAVRRDVVERHLVYQRPESGWELDLFPVISKDKKGLGVRISF
jgi:hypothetical protein